jgi:CheY-like chemotaxis protein
MARRKVLAVDDETNTRLTLEEAVEPLGYSPGPGPCHTQQCDV